MRHSRQLSLSAPWIAHVHAVELAAISEILDSETRIAALVEQDLLRSCRKNALTGRPGLTGDQVIRIALVRQMNAWTYAELAFHLADSVSYSTFCRVGSLSGTPSKSAVAANLRKLHPETLHEINQLIVLSAAKLGIERGRTVRIDSTVVEAWVHAPTDSLLLCDGIRVLLRLLRRAEHLTGFTAYHRHLKRAKRRLMEIQHLPPRATRARQRAYRDLIILAQATIGYAACALEELSGDTNRPRLRPPVKPLVKLHRQLAHYIPLVERVIQQTTRRVLHGESVPATEKVVSLFEPHTDVLVKDRRETYYGHKIFLTGGASGLILDCAIAKANPADSTWAVPMLKRQRSLYGRAPRQASFDGGFASKENLVRAKQLGTSDVCFAKRRGLAVLDMVKSSWVYRKLRAFRAGIESVISLLKRAFGLDRCTWKGATGFVAYVRMGVLTANLLILARHRLA
ncbi:MAG: ISNCY family transposase [Gemmatimonadota bacterium]|nr:ISNCY family transposase [Gemmatimonadota bacterium]